MTAQEWLDRYRVMVLFDGKFWTIGLDNQEPVCIFASHYETWEKMYDWLISPDFSRYTQIAKSLKKAIGDRAFEALKS